MPVSLVILFLSNPMGKVFDAGCLSLGFWGLVFRSFERLFAGSVGGRPAGRVLAATNLFTQLSGIAFIFFHSFLSNYLGLTAKQELLVILVPSCLIGLVTLRALPGGVSRVFRSIVGK